MNRILLFISIFLSTFFTFAQRWEVQAGVVASFSTSSVLPENNWSGIYLAGRYHYTLTEKNTIFSGLTVQNNDWGNHLLLALGTEYELLNKGIITGNIAYTAENGWALFSPKALFTHSSKLLLIGEYKLKNEHKIGIGTGVQYITTPSYRDYSSIYQSWNMPFLIRFTF